MHCVARRGKMVKLLLAFSSGLTAVFFIYIVLLREQLPPLQRLDNIPQPFHSAGVARLYDDHDQDRLDRFCERCRRYPDVPIRNLSECTICYQEVQDESVETKVRNRLLLQYHERAKTAGGRKQRLPDIIGVGVRKCGTSWLSHVLRKHPMIKTNPDREEQHFFNLRHNYEQGPEFYRSLLPNVTEFELSMEKTPGYFNFPRWDANIPYLIKSLAPNAKLWVILCDPVRRAISDFIQVNVTDQKPLPPTFEDYVNQYLPQARRMFSSFSNINENSFLWRRVDYLSIVLSLGIYYPMMKEWLQYFPHQIQVISGEELIENPGMVFDTVQEFLGIPRLLLPEDFERNPETGLYCVSPTFAIDSKLYKVPKKCISAKFKGRTRGINGPPFNVSRDALRRLEVFYKPFNEELFRLLGRRLW